MEILQAVTVTENLAELLATIRHKLSAIVDTRNFFVALYHPETESYTFPYIVDDYSPARISGMIHTPGQMKKSLTDYVRRSGQAQLIDEKKHRQFHARRGRTSSARRPRSGWGFP